MKRSLVVLDKELLDKDCSILLDDLLDFIQFPSSQLNLQTYEALEKQLRQLLRKAIASRTKSSYIVDLQKLDTEILERLNSLLDTQLTKIKLTKWFKQLDYSFAKTLEVPYDVH